MPPGDSECRRGRQPVPMVSVVITTYNYGAFIEQAIDSVLAQDFPLDRMEIIVVDDGSTDDTSERVERYGDRIKYFYKPNGGQASALNYGFAVARGDIIALLDADDLFMPGKLSRVVNAFEQNPDLGMVYHPKRYSVIGLGTWQFGSREWGYGARLRRRRGGRIVPRARELGITVFDTAEIYGFGRSERILGEALGRRARGRRRRRDQGASRCCRSPRSCSSAAVASAHRLGVRHDRPLPGAPAEPGRPRRHHDARACGRCATSGSSTDVGVSQLPAAPLAARRGRARRAGAHQPGAVQPGRPRPDGRPAAVGARSGRPPRDRLQPARPGPAVRPVRRGAPPVGAVRAANALFLPENLDAAAPLLSRAARGRRAATASTPAQTALAWLVHHPHVVAIPGASSVAQVESNAAAAELDARRRRVRRADRGGGGVPARRPAPRRSRAWCAPTRASAGFRAGTPPCGSRPARPAPGRRCRAGSRR